MSKVKVTALTPIHIGSGDFLYENNDFRKAKDSEGCPVIGILDTRKLLGIIGESRISQWVALIENRKSLDTLIGSRPIEKYTSRLIDDYCEDLRTDTLKEHIHDGLGRPYIPGSSIKGAIRTAVLATEAAKLEASAINVGYNPRKPSASAMEKHLFGKDPNSDVFRFLQVGDALFGKNHTCAITMVNLNERERQDWWDTSKKQTIEALAPEDESTFEIRLKTDAYQKSSNSNAVGRMPDCMSSLPALLRAINAHTKSLLDSEINKWKAKARTLDDDHAVQSYIDSCNEILDNANHQTDGKSCVLRIGHGSGWRFITGAWSERYGDFDAIVNASRPNNNRYSNYDFPKSRRVSKEYYLLGFASLTLLNE